MGFPLPEKESDWLIGGSGNDLVLGNHGDDTLSYDIDMNQGFYDYYHGGSGYDILHIAVTDTQLDVLGITAQDIIDFFNNENGINQHEAAIGPRGRKRLRCSGF